MLIFRLLAIVAFFIGFAFYGCRFNFLTALCQEYTWLSVAMVIVAAVISLLLLYVVIKTEIDNLLGAYSDDLAKIGKVKDLEE